MAEPEKVSVLEPEVYQDRANTNKPNIRTTFYAPIDQENIEFRIWKSKSLFIIYI